MLGDYERFERATIFIRVRSCLFVVIPNPSDLVPQVTTPTPRAPGAKKPAGKPAGRKGETTKSGDRFGQRSVEVDGVRVISFYAVQLMASLQHAVEFVDEH